MSLFSAVVSCCTAPLNGVSFSCAFHVALLILQYFVDPGQMPRVIQPKLVGAHASLVHQPVTVIIDGERRTLTVPSVKDVAMSHTPSNWTTVQQEWDNWRATNPKAKDPGPDLSEAKIGQNPQELVISTTTICFPKYLKAAFTKKLSHRGARGVLSPKILAGLLRPQI